jgi:stage V sporulation protein B
VISILQSVEAVMIPGRLQMYGLTSSQALAIYGTLTGMAMHFIMFPSALTNSIAVMLLPEVAEAQSLNHTNKISRNASVSLSFCLSIGILCTGIFLYYGMDMGVLFFKNEMAGQFIRNLSWLCPFLYIATTMGSILNGMGKTSLTFTNSLISLIVQLAFIIFGLPRFGIGAYLVGMLVSELTLCFLHLEAVKKSAALSFQPFHQLARPLCAFFLSYWITQTFTGSLYRQFPFHPMAKLLVSAGAVSGIYLLLLILTAGWERK